MLAYALRKELNLLDVEVESHDRDTCDITDMEVLETIFSEFKPEMVFNCAAYTAVDKAEEDFEMAMAVNCDGVRNLAEMCKKYSSVLVHYSTDYVFNGSKEAYDEDDPRDPINKYGESKAKGEEAIEEVFGEDGEFYIARTSWLYGPNGPNFVETMLRLGKERDSLGVVNDQHGSPTLTVDLARASLELTGLTSDTDYPYGIYHLSNDGDCTWFEYTCLIFEIAEITTPVKPITTEEFPRPATRPAYSILNNNKGPVLRSWEEALREYFLIREE